MRMESYQDPKQNGLATKPTNAGSVDKLPPMSKAIADGTFSQNDFDDRRQKRLCRLNIHEHRSQREDNGEAGCLREGRQKTVHCPKTTLNPRGGKVMS